MWVPLTHTRLIWKAYVNVGDKCNHCRDIWLGLSGGPTEVIQNFLMCLLRALLHFKAKYLYVCPLYVTLGSISCLRPLIPYDENAWERDEASIKRYIREHYTANPRTFSNLLIWIREFVDHFIASLVNPHLYKSFLLSFGFLFILTS